MLIREEVDVSGWISAEEVAGGCLRYSQHLLVDGLEGIDTLLQINVVRGQLSLSWGVLLIRAAFRNKDAICFGAHLVIGLTKLFLGVLESAGRKGGHGRSEGTDSTIVSLFCRSTDSRHEGKGCMCIYLKAVPNFLKLSIVARG